MAWHNRQLNKLELTILLYINYINVYLIYLLNIYNIFIKYTVISKVAVYLVVLRLPRHVNHQR